LGRGGGGGAVGSGAGERPALPKRPPFTAFVANVPYDCGPEDVEVLFEGLKVTDLRPLRNMDNPEMVRGIFVEFKSRGQLRQALDLNGTPMKGRPVRVEVAQARRNKGFGFGQKDWRSAGSSDGRGEKELRRRASEPRSPSSRGKPRGGERRRLELAARTRPVRQQGEPPSPAAARGQGGNIFGGGKPVNTSSKIAEMDGRERRERQVMRQAERREKRAAHTPAGGGAAADQGAWGKGSSSLKGGSGGGSRGRGGGGGDGAAPPPIRTAPKQEARGAEVSNAFSLLQVDD